MQVSSNPAANVLRIGKHVVTQSPEEPGTQQVAGQHGLQVEPLVMAEAGKADGALTCCSLLFAAPKYPS
jgi:dimethylargininase